MSTLPSATPTRDERDGMAWWNALTKDRRAYWLREASTAIVAEAWAEFKRRRNASSEKTHFSTPSKIGKLHFSVSNEDPTKA